MSQAKVDKYKKEKKNRSKTIKRRKIRNFLLVMLLVFVVSMCIGYPLGKFLYKKSYEKRMANATIEASAYNYWAQQYIYGNYGHYFVDEEEPIVSTTAETSEATALDATDSDATN